MSDEPTPVVETTKLKKKRAHAKKYLARGAVGKNYMNSEFYKFVHVKGNLKVIRGFKFETSAGWHCVFFWAGGFIFTQWLPTNDWTPMPKGGPRSPQALKEMLLKRPLPSVAPNSESPAAPPPATAASAPAPTESYTLRDMRGQSLQGMDTVGVAAAAEFAKQEAERAITLARARALRGTQAQPGQGGIGIDANWD